MIPQKLPTLTETASFRQVIQNRQDGNFALALTAYGIDYKVTDGTRAETYDYLLAFRRNKTDRGLRSAIQHMAGALLMETGVAVHLYYYGATGLCSDAVSDFYTTPSGYEIFSSVTLY